MLLSYILIFFYFTFLRIKRTRFFRLPKPKKFTKSSDPTITTSGDEDGKVIDRTANGVKCRSLFRQGVKIRGVKSRGVKNSYTRYFLPFKLMTVSSYYIY